jgi:hypothetical protein
MYFITRTPDKGIHCKAKPGNDLPKDVFDTFHYALGAYGHLVDYHERLTGSEWVERIKSTYADSARVQRVVSSIQTAMSL